MFGKKKANRVDLNNSQTVATQSLFHIVEVLMGRQIFLFGKAKVVCEEPVYGRSDDNHWQQVQYDFTVTLFDGELSLKAILRRRSQSDDWSFNRCVMHLEHFNRGRSFDAEAHYDYDDFIKNGGGYLTIIDVVDADKSKRHIAGTSWTDRVQVTAKQCEEAYGNLLNGEYRRRCNQ